MAVLVVEDVAVGGAGKEPQDNDMEMDAVLPNVVVPRQLVHQYQGSTNHCKLKPQMNLCSSP